MAVLFPIVNSKSMWGARKKRETVEEDSDDVNQLLQNLAGKQKRTPRRDDYQVVPPQRRSGRGMPNIPNVPSLAEFKAMAFGYLETMETLLENDVQIAQIFNPEVIQSVLDTVFTPEVLEAVPDDVRGYLDSLDLKNPRVLKQAMSQSIPVIREYLEKIFEYVENPAKLQEFLSQFPEYQTIVTALATGDYSALQDMILNSSILDENQKETVQKIIAGDFSGIPGLDEEQQSTLSSLFAGDWNSIFSTLKSNFANPEVFESLRQQLLATGPEVTDTLAELGLSGDLLNNPKKFQAEVQGKVTDLLQSFMAGMQEDNAEVEAAVSSKGRKTAKRDARRFAA